MMNTNELFKNFVSMKNKVVIANSVAECVRALPHIKTRNQNFELYILLNYRWH